MSAIRRLCVFCGSNRGTKPVYEARAKELGRELARRKIGIVFGGGNIGLMGALADAALADGGDVTGVIPYGLVAREVAHAHLTKQHVVRSMHERKALMAELSDGFVALPGGYGTFEELFEIVTWAQLGMHRKPVIVLDVEDYYAPLFELLDRGVREGFLKRENRGLVARVTSVAALFEHLDRFVAPELEAWIDAQST
ncbi:MAG: TIGR00730 family Rossman fold protein [Planctomycetes bacterium]|nr:TIGR00730 family Rossman fold protein [Planctomycetota bacterium]